MGLKTVSLSGIDSIAQEDQPGKSNWAWQKSPHDIRMKKSLEIDTQQCSEKGRDK